MQTIEKALQYLQDKHQAEWCGKYGEPGYQDPEGGIIFANWNNVPQGLQDWLETQGFTLQWSDEWIIDYNNDKAYRSSPDCYQWECQFLVGDGEYIFPDDGADVFIEHCSITDYAQPLGCLPSWVTAEDLEAAGYSLEKEGLENGWHPGQTDDPTPIAKAAFEEGAERVVFRKVENSQFYIVFECWVLWPEVEL